METIERGTVVNHYLPVAIPQLLFPSFGLGLLEVLDFVPHCRDKGNTLCAFIATWFYKSSHVAVGLPSHTFLADLMRVDDSRQGDAPAEVPFQLKEKDTTQSTYLFGSQLPIISRTFPSFLRLASEESTPGVSMRTRRRPNISWFNTRKAVISLFGSRLEVARRPGCPVRMSIIYLKSY